MTASQSVSPEPETKNAVPLSPLWRGQIEDASNTVSRARLDVTVGNFGHITASDIPKQKEARMTHRTFVRQLISLPAVALLFVSAVAVGAFAQENRSNSSILPSVCDIANTGAAHTAPTFQGCKLFQS